MAAAGFLSLSEWSFTICLMPNNHKLNVLSVLLNNTFPSFSPLEYCFSIMFTFGVTDTTVAVFSVWDTAHISSCLKKFYINKSPSFDHSYLVSYYSFTYNIICFITVIF